LFPLEVAAGSSGTGNGDAGLVQGYPVQAVVWRGQVDDVVAGATDWTRRWIERNRGRLVQLTANFMATRASESGEMALYFVPRDRAKQRMSGFTGLAGGIEVLGEIVLLSSEEKALLDQGSVDYAILEAALATLSTPLEIA